MANRKYKVNSQKDIETVEASLVPTEDLFASFSDLLKAGLFVIHPYKWLKNNFSSHCSFSSSKEHGYYIHWVNILLIEGKAIRLGSFRNRKAFNKLKLKNEIGYYLCDSDINEKYIKDMEKLGVTEESIQHTMIAMNTDLRSECNSGYGRDRIDLKSSSTIAEIKKISHWKHALGQLLVYSHINPEHKRTLILFGKSKNKKDFDFLVEVCGSHSISVEFVDVDINDNSQIKSICI
ncbi:hypothetical protein F9L16_04415 [Agarivorans sp. B2Z047]|uniref:hypothetical protein n=1 Tax=Agarivorans sp. B2Z047 TaxID=2652721 RepID=UPI00128DAD9D|nr:hypothetical protein [Agarivorans sp. B2Z047]MPW28242.1 hypothetical protein [Agarivorans sp. B2Z047]UQN43929.1 hypothetical protein LQZ07_05525 [Agarivorans sp. B2Z047]